MSTRRHYNTRSRSRNNNNNNNNSDMDVEEEEEDPSDDEEDEDSYRYDHIVNDYGDDSEDSEDDEDDDDDSMFGSGFGGGSGGGPFGGVHGVPPNLMYVLRQQALNGRAEAMVLMESMYRNGMITMDEMAGGGGAGAGIDNEDDDDDDDDEEDDRPCQCVNCTRLKCPVCAAVHNRDASRNSGSSSFEPRPENQCSHGAMMLFIAADCPVCMEEKIDPPMIALACGHVLCTSDFKTMGGRIGVVAPEAEPEPAPIRQPVVRARPQPPQQQQQQPLTGARFPFFGMGHPGLAANPYIMNIHNSNRRLFGNYNPYISQGDEDDDEEEDDEDEQEETREYFFGGQSDFEDQEDEGEEEDQEEEEDDDDDDDLPPLISRESSRNKRSHRYPTRSTIRGSAEALAAAGQDDDDDDSDEEMPDLVAR